MNAVKFVLVVDFLTGKPQASDLVRIVAHLHSLTFPTPMHTLCHYGIPLRLTISNNVGANKRQRLIGCGCIFVCCACVIEDDIDASHACIPVS